MVQLALPMTWIVVFQVREKQTRDSMMRWRAICWMSSVGRVVMVHFPFDGGGKLLLRIVSFAHSYISERVLVSQRDRQFKTLKQGL